MRGVTATIVTGLLLLSALFVPGGPFVEKEILSQGYAFIAGTILLSVLILLSGKKLRAGVDWPFAAIGVFLGYVLLRMGLAGSPALPVLAVLSFALLYLVFRALQPDNLKHVDLIIMAACLIQALYGILQYAGILHAHSGFRITGSFDNPAGLAVCLAIGFSFCVSLFRRPGIIAAVIFAVVIILSGSRAGILAIPQRYQPIRVNLLCLIVQKNQTTFSCQSPANLFAHLYAQHIQRKE